MTETPIHHLPVQVYYEDTDHSGAVYYANYLKYCERGREMVLGIPRLVALWRDYSIGFAVYKVAVGYFEAAEFGETLDVRSSYHLDSDYRMVWTQDIWRPNAKKAAVKSTIELICVDQNKQLLMIEKALSMAG